MSRAYRFLRLSAALLGLWLALSGAFDAFHVGAGAAAAAAIAAAAVRLSDGPTFPAARLLLFLPWLLGQVLLSNLRVARLALGGAVSPRFVRAASRLRSPAARAVAGCAITLTPGTLTVDAGEEEMLVHALDAASAREIAEGAVAARVARVFREEGP